MSKTTERAWAAGFFDGEGCVFVRHTKRHKGGTTGKMYPLLTVEIGVTQVRPEPLDRFAKALGFGVVRGPYGGKGNHKAYYRWFVAGRPRVLRTAKILWPYLSLPKREQFQRCWEELAEKATKKSPKLGALPK